MSRKNKKNAKKDIAPVESVNEVEAVEETGEGESFFNLEDSTEALEASSDDSFAALSDAETAEDDVQEEGLVLSEDDAAGLEDLIDTVFDDSTEEAAETFNVAADVESEDDVETLSEDAEEDSLQALVGGAGLDFTEYEAGEQGELLASENGEAVQPVYITDDEAISIMESLLFISDRPVGMTTFKNAFEGTNVNTKKIKELINELKVDFVERRRGVSLEEVDGAFQLRTKADNQDYIKKILKPKVFKLTGPSLETLSVIAYKQPCVKSEVDEVRGVESGHLIRALMDKGLVAFDGKSELPGRPMQYKTTRKFLEVFGLRNLSELPSLAEIEELLPEGIGDVEEKQTLSELAGKLEENFEAASYSIGEEELGKITEQLSEISTETEFFEVEKQRQREARDRDRAEGIREALILGDAVDPKDEKWLQRYDIKINQAAQDGGVASGEDVTDDELIEAADVQDGVSSDEVEMSAEDAESEDSEDVSEGLEALVAEFDAEDEKSEDTSELDDLVEKDPLELL